MVAGEVKRYRKLESSQQKGIPQTSKIEPSYLKNEQFILNMIVVAAPEADINSLKEELMQSDVINKSWLIEKLCEFEDPDKQ